jgi:XTP/dITP diphosphohydrolase
MEEIVFATTNAGKFSSAQRVLKKFGVTVTQSIIPLPEAQDTLDVIAEQKVRYAFSQLQKPVLAMDAGFFIHSLQGFPMMYVKPVLESIGIEGLLTLVAGKDRSCEFREVLCYMDANLVKPLFFERVVKGTLAQKPRGQMSDKHWSLLARIFIPDGETKTMAEMGDKEFEKFRTKVDACSHFEQFAQYLQQTATNKSK